MLELLLPILVGVVAALAMLGLVRRWRTMTESEGGPPTVSGVAARGFDAARSWSDTARGLLAPWARRSMAFRPSRPSRSSRLSRRSIRAGKPGEPPQSDPGWVKAAGPQAWRDRKDVGCQQCAPSWELGMKNCIRCGRRLADVFTAGARGIKGR